METRDVGTLSVNIDQISPCWKTRAEYTRYTRRDNYFCGQSSERLFFGALNCYNESWISLVEPPASLCPGGLRPWSHEHRQSELVGGHGGFATWLAARSARAEPPMRMHAHVVGPTA